MGCMPRRSSTLAAGLVAGTSTRQAFRAVGRACLKQIVDNTPPLLKGDAEGVHQMRVGLRRLRAAMALFADLVRNAETTTIKRELRWLVGELAPAREMQVLIERVAEVASECFRALTLDVAAWLEAGRWMRPQDDLVRSLGDRPLENFAADELTRRLRKVRKSGRRLVRLDARRRHKLRIRVKKLRYAGEFFGELFAGGRARRRYKRLSNALERLQDGLGDLNDILVDEKLVAEAVSRRRHGHPRRRAFAAGVVTGQEEARFMTAMAAATKGYARLVAVKGFWR